MARLPPPRHAVHSSLRIPNLRAGDDSPLSITFRRVARDAFNSPRLPTPRIRHRGLNDTYQLNRDHATTPGDRSRQNALAMSVLQTQFQTSNVRHPRQAQFAGVSDAVERTGF